MTKTTDTGYAVLHGATVLVETLTQEAAALAARAIRAERKIAPIVLRRSDVAAHIARLRARRS